MRSAPTAMLALPLLVLLAACGGATHTRAASHARPAHAGKASGALSAREGAAFERAVTLRPADLPGFRESRERQHPQTAAEKRAGEAMRVCVGAPLRQHGSRRPERESPNFEREGGVGVETISSNVEVLRSSADATLELQLVRSAHTRTCVAHFLTSLLGHLSLPRASVSPVKVRTFSPSATGTAGAFGWRVGATVSIHGLKLPLRFDLLGFAYRSAVVTLFDVAFPRLGETQEQRLFSLLIARAISFPNEALAPSAAAQAA